MSRVVLGVAGGIAAYKAVELLRRLTESGHDVTVVPTRAALEFVGAPTWSALSGKPVRTDVWTDVEQVPHVRIGQDADLVVVAPATADLLARAAHGLADDLLTNVLLTARCPVLVAPAMHTEMWEHAATQANVATLRSRGVQVVEPAVGRLTGKDSGKGRLPDPAELYDLCVRALAGREQDLAGRRVVVSAGGTREHLDPVRFLGNRSSGKQGYALARAAQARGADVVLVSSAALPDPAGVAVVRVTSALELRDAVLTEAKAADAVVMAAAVADYRPVERLATKRKKTGTLTVELVQNPDVLRRTGRRAPARPGAGGLRRRDRRRRRRRPRARPRQAGAEGLRPAGRQRGRRGRPPDRVRGRRQRRHRPRRGRVVVRRAARQQGRAGRRSVGPRGGAPHLGRGEPCHGGRVRRCLLVLPLLVLSACSDDEPPVSRAAAVSSPSTSPSPVGSPDPRPSASASTAVASEVPSPAGSGPPSEAPSGGPARTAPAFRGDVDGDGDPDVVALDGDLAVELSDGGRTVTAPVLADAPPRVAGAEDVDRDGRAEVFVRTAQGSSTTFLTPYRYDGTTFAPLLLDGQHVRLGIGGSVTHGEGFSCTEDGRLVVRSALRQDDGTWDLTSLTYQVVGHALAQVDAGDEAGVAESDPRVGGSYLVDCRSVGEGE